MLDPGCGGDNLGSALNGKGCELTGLDLKLDRIDANRKFHQSLEERDIEKQD